MDIIERAARAVCDAEGLNPDGKCGNRAMWQTFEKATRAVLEAIRALPDAGWRDIESDKPPVDQYLILCGYLDGPNDPRIKMGYWWTEENRWKIDGASWRPVYWMPLPQPPEKA